MSEQHAGRLAFLKRIPRLWFAPAVLGLGLLIALAMWLMPRKIDRVVSADGQHAWDAGQVRQRQVLWEPAQPIEGLLPDDQGGSFITPRLTDGGGTLYFTYRPKGGNADIYRSRLLDGQWEHAQPVRELNTTSDDIGPTLSRDGRQLYFYSNRPGGYGGFDLYVSDRTGAGWGTPRNLGPKVNSAAHEYDPAIAPDGLSLYFASNRNPGAAKDPGPGAGEWSATLRAHPGLPQFDLYAVQRSSVQEEWSSPEALDELNTAANEGAPFVSPAGNFLYFASDRPARRGEAPNLDLYRARLIDGRFRNPENLGPGINTADHETEPALSPEGFTLVFSSGRDGTASLYRSTAQEVYAQTEWDTSRLQAVGAHWWQALLLTSFLSVTLALFLCNRGWFFQKASAARFLAASALIHCLVLLWMWGVPLAGKVIEQAEEIRISEQGPPLPDDSAAQTHQDRRQAFDKVADLKAVEPAPLPQEIRQAAPAPDVPDRVENLVPIVPLDVARSLPLERLMLVPAKELPAEIKVGSADLPRRSGLPRLAIAAVRIQPDPAPAEAAPAEKPVEKSPTVQAREELAPPPALELPRRAPQPVLGRPAAVEVKTAPLAGEEARVQAPRLEPERRQPGRVAEPARTSEKVEVASQPSVEPNVLNPQAASITVGRQDTAPPTQAGPLERPTPRDPAPRVEKVAETGGPKLAGDMPKVVTLPGQLTRQPARGLRVANSVDKVGEEAFLLRKEDIRKEAIGALGGTKESEAAVERGLDWLAAHQNRDGSWSLNAFQANCKHPQCTAAATVSSDTAGTGLALLPFLAAGNTHKAGKHQQTVARAVKWLVEQQRADGGWLARGDSKPLYGHGLAAIALCEVYGMTKDLPFRVPAQKAIDYMVKAQHAASGGWRYYPNTPGDTSVLGWQVMALKSGEMAGLSVPPQALEGAKRWLKSVEANTPGGGQFGYQNPTPTPAMTAQGLLCLQLMGTRRADPRLQAGAEYLLKHLPQRNVDTSYYWYHATQVMYHMQGKYWKAWNERMRDMLVTTQIATGPMAGTWEPADSREKTGGRICSTALRLLMLEVYYRHLPLYQQLEK